MRDKLDLCTPDLPMPEGRGALIGYARVSTQDQDTSMQIDALRQSGCNKIFQDIASGANTARPGLDEALAYLRPFDTLVVWKLDRLGRSLAHLISVVEDLRKRQIGFKSLTNSGVDTTTSQGRLIFGIFASLADFERELISERTKAALAARRKQGIRGGRRHTVTPSILKKAHHYIRHKELTVRETALALNVSKSALYRALAAEKGD